MLGLLLALMVGEIECTPGWPDRCAVALEAGEEAPFEGQLLSPELAIWYAQTASAAETKAAAAIARERSLGAAERERDLRILKADLKAEYGERIARAEARADAAESQPSPWLVAGLTAGGMLVLCGLVVLSLGSASAAVASIR